ncbi:MAG: hypothetical protein IT276_15165 [Ignavibacteriaceae bacterium]|nr:hypothetical protein [Ignavibacteriaceae bacterium]HRN25933.1 hypothetical protein [Ignavibacteriaceae bacterium]HRP91656.1 hypothetical protein [Ignavibacteriaceae bacterium]HRQ53551.1 hypothetical protein [Ignavibacteriaceae bacterium]
MRSIFLICIFLLIYSNTPTLLAQNIASGCDMVTLPLESETQQIEYKGKYITSTGTLRVLVVLVRFADDNETSSI